MADDGLFNNAIESSDDKKFYLQIHRSKLYDYAAQGLIVPSGYMGSEVEDDIQAKHGDFLLLSHGYIESFDENDVLLEIIFSATELQMMDANKIGSLYFWAIPLPITRINKVYTYDEQTQADIIKHSINYESGYIPEDRFALFKEDAFILQKRDEEKENSNDVPYKTEVIKFDKILGMFAFIKNTNLYYMDQKGIFSNYSDHYFSLLSKFNTTIDTEKSNFFKIISKDDILFQFIYSDQSMNVLYIERLIKNTKDEDIRELFTLLLKNPNSKRKVLHKLRERDDNYFYVCLLYIHRHKDGNQKDNFKSNIINDIPYEKAEYALAFLGLYYGYRILRASEEVPVEDKYFKKLVDTRVNMKFKLDTKLDYIAIESIYNYVFYNKVISADFNYLSFPEGVNKIKIPTNLKYDINVKRNCQGSEYIKITKKSLGVIAQKVLEEYPDEIQRGEYYLTCFVDKYYKHILKNRKIDEVAEPYFEILELLRNLEEERSTFKQNELFKVFALDGK